MRTVVTSVVLASAWLASACNSAQPQNLNADLEMRVAALEKTVAALEGRKRNPTTSTIVLSKSSPAAGCDTAKVLDYRVGNLNERHVRWNIEDECNLGGTWRLELVFTANGDGQYPFRTLTVRSRPHNRFIQDRIKRNADVAYGVYSYKIFLVQGVLPPRELADPELEVEPPPVRIVQ